MSLERRLELVARLSDATAALSQAATPEDVGAAVLREGMRVLEADAGFLGRFVEPEDVLRVIHLVGFGREPAERLEVPLDAPYPLAEAVRARRPLFIGSNEELASEHPGLRRILSADHACATMPLAAGGRVLGALNVTYDAPRRFEPEERELMAVLAERCAHAMLRSELYAVEVERRQLAEGQVRELRALELSDDVVQELATAKLALELDRRHEALAALERALGASKAIIARLATGSETLRREG